MDINNTTIPRKIICTDNKVLNCGMKIWDKNSSLLTIGEEYTLTDMEVDSWSTTIWLEEFPDVPFNSVNFKEVESNKTITEVRKVKSLDDYTLHELFSFCDKRAEIYHGYEGECYNCPFNCDNDFCPINAFRNYITTDPDDSDNIYKRDAELALEETLYDDN